MTHWDGFLFSFFQLERYNAHQKLKKTKAKIKVAFFKIGQTSVVSSEQICSKDRCADTRQIK